MLEKIIVADEGDLQLPRCVAGERAWTGLGPPLSAVDCIASTCAHAFLKQNNAA